MTVSRSVVALIAALSLTLAGCGSDGSGGSGSTAASQAASLAKTKKVLTDIVRRTVDLDSCADFSTRYLDGVSVADCNGDGTLGVSAGDYRVADVAVSGDTAKVKLALRPGGERTYRLVREQGAWKVDGQDEKFEGRLGDGFLSVANYEEDGRDINRHVTVRLVSVKDPAPSPPYNSPGPGKRWVRAKLRLHSTGKDTFNFSTQDIKLITCDGARYEPWNAFEPALGNGGVDLSEGDTVVGYLGYKVQKNRKACEIRLVDPFDGAPIKWKLR